MEKIYYNVNGLRLDLNGDMLENVREKIGHPEAYVKKEFGFLYFIYKMPNGEMGYSFSTNKAGEMYAYLCGLLNF